MGRVRVRGVWDKKEEEREALHPRSHDWNVVENLPFQHEVTSITVATSTFYGEKQSAGEAQEL